VQNDRCEQQPSSRASSQGAVNRSGIGNTVVFATESGYEFGRTPLNPRRPTTNVPSRLQTVPRHTFMHCVVQKKFPKGQTYLSRYRKASLAIRRHFVLRLWPWKV